MGFVLRSKVVTVEKQGTTQRREQRYERWWDMATFIKERLIKQLKLSEGFKPKAYWDNKQWSVGYGTRGVKGEVVNRAEASRRLEQHMDVAVHDFDKLFKGHDHKFNEVRTEAFIELLYNMGLPELSLFKRTLAAIKFSDNPDWDEVAKHLKDSKWYRQTGSRGQRIVTEVRTGQKAGAS